MAAYVYVYDDGGVAAMALTMLAYDDDDDSHWMKNGGV
jgi:hypothetical protein